MKKKFNAKKMAVTMIASMMLMTGCGSAAPESEEITRASENQNTGSAASQVTTEGFRPLTEMKEECKFEKTFSESEDKDAPYPDVKIEAEYPLSGGANDKIAITYDSKKWEGKLSVNDATIDYPIDAIKDAMLIDIDSSDKYKEIAILGEGPNGEPVVCIYGYVDGKLYDYGYYQGADEYDEVLFDKKGKFIDIGCYDYFIAEKYLYKYHQIKDNAACEIAVDYKSALNREYTILKDIYVAFGETDDIKFDDNLVDYTNVFKLQVGEKIVIIDEQKDSSLYYVQLSDGRKGLLSLEVWVDIQDTTPITIDGFMSISEAKEDYKFTKESKLVEGEMNPFTIFAGEYALNSDKKDKIVVTSNSSEGIGKIKVNDVANDVCDLEGIFTLKAGEEIVIIKANPYDEVYYVELPDGRRGVMTTRVAG